MKTFTFQVSLADTLTSVLLLQLQKCCFFLLNVEMKERTKERTNQ